MSNTADEGSRRSEPSTPPEFEISNEARRLKNTAINEKRESLMRWLFSIIFGITLLCGSMSVEAGGFGGGCPPWRPCGWGNTWGGNRLFPQGANGADFRPACQAHDDCYANGCNRRGDCDRQFRNDMFQACECSNHPGLCRMKARYYFTVTRVFGGIVR